jgi:hypothetical protein
LNVYLEQANEGKKPTIGITFCNAIWWMLQSHIQVYISFLPPSGSLSQMHGFLKGEMITSKAGGWMTDRQNSVLLLEIKQIDLNLGGQPFLSWVYTLWKSSWKSTNDFFYNVINNRRMPWKYVRYQNVQRNIWATEYW